MALPEGIELEYWKNDKLLGVFQKLRLPSWWTGFPVVKSL